MPTLLLFNEPVDPADDGLTFLSSVRSFAESRLPLLALLEKGIYWIISVLQTFWHWLVMESHNFIVWIENPRSSPNLPIFFLYAPIQTFY
jgi:hypothetical protein